MLTTTRRIDVGLTVGFELFLSDQSRSYSPIRRILPSLYNMDSLVHLRTCPSSGVKLCTYISWFAGSSWKAYHRHITATNIPKGAHRTYMRFRLGCADTEVNNGRFITTQCRIPQAQRLCRCCNNSQVEDDLHLVLECPAYTHIRERYHCQSRHEGFFFTVPPG